MVRTLAASRGLVAARALSALFGLVAARALSALFGLVAARARRRPGRWLLPALGIAVATAFAGIVAAEGTIAGDEAARDVLAGLAPLDRAVRVTWQGPVTPAVERHARSAIQSLGPVTQVTLLNPVRLSGVIVRPAAVAPLDRWLSRAPALASCRPENCPVYSAGGAALPGVLKAPGVRLVIAGKARLGSPAPLGFTPEPSSPPVVLTSDVTGLARLPALTSIYRTRQWLALLPTAGLRSWQLAALARRLQLMQAMLLASSDQFNFTAPFDQLAEARARAEAAPNRLLLAGGGALAALALFLALAVGGLRRELHAELDRLRTAGARSGQCIAFVVAESALLSGVAIAVGAASAVAGTAVLAGAQAEPAGGVLAHSLLTPAALAVLAGGWAAATALLVTLLTVRGAWIADLLVVGAAIALALSLALGSGADSSVSVLLAPLSCLTAGLVIFRAAVLVLPASERLARRGPLLLRLSLVSLARSPGPAALAIAFVAVAVGLGGFALSYRSTLLRGASDEAANGVPVDAIVAAGSDFRTPLQLAPLRRWRALADGGAVWPVRRTFASYQNGGAAVTVPALGVPASAVRRLRGWRESDGSTSQEALARLLAPTGPVRAPGPTLPAAARTLSVRIRSAIAVSVQADLRAPGGTIRQVSLTRPARLPGTGGPYELAAFELDEPTGLRATNGHQDAENPAAATQASGTVRLGPAFADGRPIDMSSWTAVGAATGAHAGNQDVALRFSDTGEPGIVRPPQPSDFRPIPVLVDPRTAAAAGRGGRLALTVDGLPVTARVIGVAARFPTIPGSGAGFVVADEATLAGALDAQLPGQGRPDELWLATSDPSRLRAALRHTLLTASFRADVERRLRTAPVARAVLGTLIGAAAVAGALAIIGLLVALLGAARDRVAERDFVEQGVSPRALRRELTLRMIVTAAVGVVSGLALAVTLTRLAVAAVRAAGALAAPQPPLVTVAPWGQLAIWGVVSVVALAAVATTASRWTGS
jgi:hypothetical protein